MSGGRDLKVEEWRVIVRREAAGVILRREAPKGSLSIQGFYGRGAKAILSLALLAQDDGAGLATQDDARVRDQPTGVSTPDPGSGSQFQTRRTQARTAYCSVKPEHR